MLWQQIAPNIRAALERDSAELTRTMLQDLLELASRYRPQPEGEIETYERHIARRRDHYEGRARKHIVRALHERYPRTAHKMSKVPINLLKQIADIDAGVYDYDADRFLERDDGSRVGEDDPAAKYWGEVLRKAKLASRIVEQERRTPAALTVPARISYDQMVGSARIDLHWPDRVWPIPHPHWPTDPRYFLGLIAEISRPDLGGPDDEERPRAFEVWTRSVSGDYNEPAFGPWFVDHVSTDGDSLRPFGVGGQYAGTVLPWVFMHATEPESTPVVGADRDLIEVIETVQVNLCNYVMVADTQAHGERVVFTNQPKGSEIAAGPGTWVMLGADDKVQTVQTNPDLAELWNGIERLLKMVARSRRQPEDAYSTEPGAPLTGVSRRIKNEPQEQKRREDAKHLIAYEEEQLLPVLADVVDTFGPQDQPKLSGFTFRVLPQQPPDFEEPSLRQQRSLEAFRENLISEARAATESQWYPTIAEAKKAKLTDERRSPNGDSTQQPQQSQKVVEVSPQIQDQGGQ